MDSLTVIPAYGRDYKSKKEVESAYKENKDFQVMSLGLSGKYVNKSDAEKYGISTIMVRYHNKAKVHVIKPDKFKNNGE